MQKKNNNRTTECSIKWKNCRGRQGISDPHPVSPAGWKPFHTLKLVENLLLKGHVVNKLRKHENADVAKAAKQVYMKWRTYYKDLKDRPQIEVKYDRKGEEMRTSGRKFLAKELGLEVMKRQPENCEAYLCIFHIKG